MIRRTIRAAFSGCRSASRASRAAAGRGGTTADTRARDVAYAHAHRVNHIQQYFVERTRLGIPIIPFDEAAHGLMREGALVFPAAIAQAATWDTALVARVAAAIARETRSRGVRQVLSPVANIADDVRWGRVEETYGEDPHLSSAMTRAFVSSFERTGTITTPKHFVANVGAGRSRQLSDRSQRAVPRGIPLPDVPLGYSGCRRTLGHDGVQLGRWRTGDAEPVAPHAEAAS